MERIKPVIFQKGINITLMESQFMNSKQRYNEILEKNFDEEVSEPAIVKFISTNSQIEWSKIFARIYNCTISSRLQECQFKYLHNILVNKYLLYKWKLLDSNLCRMCEKEVETTDHMIWECASVKLCWNEFEVLIENKFKLLVSKCDVYLGGENGLFSLLSSLAKKYVYVTVKQEKTPIFQNYINIITYTRRIEEFISVKNNKFYPFCEIWQPLLD